MLEKEFEVELKDIAQISDEDWKSHEYYIIGVPTWWDGDLQSDWEDYFDTFKDISFENKKVALFGLGDQIGYEDWYCDGLGILGEVIVNNGGKLFGFTTKDDSYEFEGSKAIKEGDTLWGLALDDDNQSELSEERLKNWVKQVTTDFNNS